MIVIDCEYYSRSYCPPALFQHELFVQWSDPGSGGKTSFTIVCNWLNENIGIIREDWDFSNSLSTFYFKYKEDAMAFMLRWA